MQTNEHVDLATWLTAVWDEEEARLTHPTFCGPVWPTTAQLLARIAADRKILAAYQKSWARSREDDPFPEGTEWLLGHRWAMWEVLKLLASPYADRPGFRPEWLVERQGVEQ